MTSTLSRRVFCRSTLAIATTAILGPADLLAENVPVIDEGAVVAAAAVAKALVQASVLVAGGSAGLRQLGNSSVFSRQTVATQLADLLDAVAAARDLAAMLAESERPYLRLRFPDQTASITETARRYVDYLGNRTDQAALAPIRSAMSQARQDLSAGAEGNGLTAAILLTSMFAAEYGAARRLTTDREELRGILDGYRLWADAMRTQGNGTIPFRRFVATAEHDAGLLAFAESPYGKRIGIGAYVIAGSQAENRIADPCVIFYSHYMQSPAQTRGGFTVPADHRLNYFWDSKFVPRMVVGYSRIKPRDYGPLGARLIEFSPGEGTHILTSEIIGGLRPPIGGQFCYAISSAPVGTPAQAFAKVDSHPSVKEDRENRAGIIAAVRNANACRIEIALSGRALGMLSQFDAVRESFERAL